MCCPTAAVLVVTGGDTRPARAVLTRSPGVWRWRFRAPIRGCAAGGRTVTESIRNTRCWCRCSSCSTAADGRNHVSARPPLRLGLTTRLTRRGLAGPGIDGGFRPAVGIGHRAVAYRGAGPLDRGDPSTGDPPGGADARQLRIAMFKDTRCWPRSPSLGHAQAGPEAGAESFRHTEPSHV